MPIRRKVLLDKGLYTKAKVQAAELGYATVNEYVIHLVERDVDTVREQEDQYEVQRRLKGLGYFE